MRTTPAAVRVKNADNTRLWGASFQRKSSNDKLSHVDRRRHSNGRFQTFPRAPFVCSTYVSIEATCPTECRFKDAGCYVQAGNAANAMKRLDAAAFKLPGELVNLHEANLIEEQWFGRTIPQDGARGGRDLRLHVGGDFASERGVRYVAGAVEGWLSRGGGAVWCYTHRWRELPRDAFGSIHILASVETALEAEEAIDLGYTPSWTLASFDSVRAFRIGATKVTPCPTQTRGVKCVKCRLCLRPIAKGSAIGFEWHGVGSAGKRRLQVIQQERSGQQRLELGD